MRLVRIYGTYDSINDKVTQEKVSQFIGFYYNVSKTFIILQERKQF